MTKQTKEGYVPTKTADLSKLPKIKGYDFSKKFDFKDFLKSYSTTGIQASKLGTAIEIVKAMKREKATTFLSYTSNMASSGIRDIIAWLAENKHVDVLIASAGGIEEDFLKCFDNFALGDFNANGKILNDHSGSWRLPHYSTSDPKTDVSNSASVHPKPAIRRAIRLPT